MNDDVPEKRRSLQEAFAALDARGKLIASLIAMGMAGIGYTGEVIVTASRAIQWPGKIESDIKLLKEGQADIPVIAGKVVVLQDLSKMSAKEREEFRRQLARLVERQDTIRLTIERLVERTGAGR